LIIFALLSFRFGLAGSFRVVSAPLISALLSFLVTNLIIGQYNLFTIFGLIITVAVAIDYAVFIRESSGDNRSTYLAITLAGLTTVLALGLLSLSHTPALSAFGASLLFGILFSYVLTPLIVKPRSIAT
jgi:predicted exporter